MFALLISSESVTTPVVSWQKIKEKKRRKGCWPLIVLDSNDRRRRKERECVWLFNVDGKTTRRGYCPPSDDRRTTHLRWESGCVTNTQHRKIKEKWEIGREDNEGKKEDQSMQTFLLQKLLICCFFENNVLNCVWK